ncbi:MAG TPA: DUF5654 family protein [archaeon]|nr:DUF5654 family protein [archaeon]
MVSEFVKQFATLIVAAFGFASALAWNTAIQNWLQSQPTLSAAGPWGYAIAVTIFAVIITMWVGKYSQEQK